MEELFCSPSYPLVLSLGSREALGKSYLLQYLNALQECHFRGSATPLLRILSLLIPLATVPSVRVERRHIRVNRIHAMPFIDIIGDFAREEPLRRVTLADFHSYDPSDELCETLVVRYVICLYCWVWCLVVLDLFFCSCCWLFFFFGVSINVEVAVGCEARGVEE